MDVSSKSLFKLSHPSTMPNFRIAAEWVLRALFEMASKLLPWSELEAGLSAML